MILSLISLPILHHPSFHQYRFSGKIDNPFPYIFRIFTFVLKNSSVTSQSSLTKFTKRCPKLKNQNQVKFTVISTWGVGRSLLSSWETEMMFADGSSRRNFFACSVMKLTSDWLDHYAQPAQCRQHAPRTSATNKRRRNHAHCGSHSCKMSSFSGQTGQHLGKRGEAKRLRRAGRTRWRSLAKTIPGVS